MAYIGKWGRYTEEELEITPCMRCGQVPSHHTFEICANGRRSVPVCKSCDIQLNRLVLEWFGLPDDRVNKMMKEYVLGGQT